MDKKLFIDDLTKKVNEFWSKKKEPLLLSNFSTFWKRDEYEHILEEKTLKQFLQSLDDVEFKIVEHPNQKAKVGIIPLREHYEFTISNSNKDSIHEQHNKEKGLIMFLNSLKNLSDKDLESINIPVSIMVKLLK